MSTLLSPRSKSIGQRAKNALSQVETARLAELEPIIERGLASFVEVGNALIEISDSRLYRATHSTFKQYCEDRWKMTAARAYQLCDAAEVIKSLPVEKSTMVDSERMARELVKVPAAKRVEVLETVQAKAKSNGNKVTAKAIKEQAAPMFNAAARIEPGCEPIQPPSAEALSADGESDALFQLKRWWKKATQKDRKEFLSVAAGREVPSDVVPQIIRKLELIMKAAGPATNTAALYIRVTCGELIRMLRGKA